MQRDPLLLAEMIDAAERIVDLTGGRTAADFEADRDRREALLWNYTVLGEAATQLSDGIKASHSHILWSDPARLRNRSCTATGPSSWTSSSPPPATTSPA
jgi:uncharacterized protein with HEPN domain